MSSDCIFCRIAAGQAQAEILYQDDDVVAFRDVNPQAPSHILVIPRKHIARLADAGPEDEGLLGRVVLAATEVARQEGIGEGFRLVVNNGRPAGQSVFHVHFHVLGGRSMSWPPG